MNASQWVSLLEVVGINLMLSSDNAIVIALACRRLAGVARRQAVWLGTIGAVLLRVLLTVAAAEILRLPYVKLAGGMLLVWVAVKLLIPVHENGADGDSCDTLGSALQTIVAADFVMSLDNVVGVAAAARGNLALMVLGLLLSVPIIVLGSNYLIRFIGRFPVVVLLGAGVLGWVGGETAARDSMIALWTAAHAPWVAEALPPILALTVVSLGTWIRRHRPEPHTDVASVPPPGCRVGRSLVAQAHR